MSAEIEIPDGPPWPAALAGGAGGAGRAQSVLWVLAEDHRALVADVHARFLGHGLAAGDPTQPAARPRDRGLWYCRLIEPNALGCQPDPGQLLGSPAESGHRVVMTVLAAQAPP
jgi:hypothetical protein